MDKFKLMESNPSVEQLVLINLLLLFTLKIVVFILGYLTIRLGYTLVKEGVKGKFKFHTELKGYKAILQSGSPGLLFVTLGIILIGFAMAYDKVIPYGKTDDNRPVHASQNNSPAQPKPPNVGPFDSSQKSK